MTTKIHNDFESASAADIKEVGAYNYWQHESTHPLCYSLRIKSLNYAENLFLDWYDFHSAGSANLERLRNMAADPHTIWVAHNAQFEKDAWDSYMVPKLKMPPLPIQRWRCTMAKAAYHSLPLSLELCGEALDIKNKKNVVGGRILDKLSKPKKDGSFWTPQDDPQGFWQLYDYCQQDTLAEEEIDDRLMDLSPEEQEIWFLDWAINRRGLHVDMPVVQKVLAFREEILSEVGAEFFELVGLKPTQRAKVKEYLTNVWKLKLPDMQAPTLKKLRASGLNPKLDRILELYGKGNLTSLAKFEAMANRADLEGVIREIIVYHGAHTGRFAGRGVQFHNMKRPEEDTDIETILGAVLNLTLQEFQSWYGV